uniref:Uncharacterized protein n=1 Tax=Anguilla anguilla TaxID=7936 RepID=A0A0E9WI57_ANGAN
MNRVNTHQERQRGSSILSLISRKHKAVCDLLTFLLLCYVS